MPVLTNVEADLLLSLPDSELEAELGRMPAETQALVLQQLMDHQPPKERAETRLIEFVRQAWEAVEPDRDFVDSWHVEGICGELEAVARKETRNLIINIPPGCMKSLLCNVFWPAWVWIQNPSARFMFASYSEDLSLRDSLKMRYLVESSWYKENWGDRVRLRIDQNQKRKYETTAGGWRLATSVGGRGTGEHPDYIGIDDPHNVKEAESDVERKSALEWFDGTISLRGATRNVCRVLVMQRLHCEDLSGHLLSKQGVNPVHVCLPMEYEEDRMPPTPSGFSDPRTEEGELLCPCLFTPEMVETAKAELASEYKRAGQLQQRPVPRAGGMFKLEWFKTLRATPAGCKRLCRYWDKAGTEDGGCYTSGTLIGEFEKRYYIVDQIRGQWSSHARETVIKETAARDEYRFPGCVKIRIEQEPGSAGMHSVDYTIGNLAGYSVKADKVSGDKATRAQPYADQMEAGNVFLIEGPWNADFIDEHTTFPNGKYKDQVDSASGAFNTLANRKGQIIIA